MKIWLVTRGEYSSFRVAAAFSSKEKAERFAYVKSFNRGVEEYELDSAKVPGVPLWSVSLKENGDVACVTGVEYPDEINYSNNHDGESFFYANYPTFQWRGQMVPSETVLFVTKVAAENERGAIKIANERRSRTLAMLGRWPTAEEVCEWICWEWGDWSWVKKVKP